VSRNLSSGMQGQDVKNLQGMLNFHLVPLGEPRLAEDGNFGPKTKAAVLKAQGIASLVADGIVGPKTTAALLSLGSVNGGVSSTPDESDAGGSTELALLTANARTRSMFPPNAPFFAQTASPFFAQTASPAVGDPPAPPTPSPASPPIVKVQSVVVQGGNQFAFNPFTVAPLVAAAQTTLIFRLGPLPAFGASPGAQFSANGFRSPNGRFTGQGFLQLGPADPLKFGSVGSFDFVNPFVQGFVQKNQGKPSQGGFAVGDQASWKLTKNNVLSLFLNVQAVAAWDLSNGRGQPVAAQVFGGLQIDLLQLARIF
jgi:hypothetical protein